MLLLPLLFISGCVGLTGQSSDKIDDQEYVLLKVNNYAGLLKLYRERLQKKEDPTVRYKVAEYYYFLDDFESSRHFLAPLLVSHPTTKNYILESKNLLDLGNKEEALSAIDKAISLEPGNGDAYNIRGVILAESGYFDEAIASFNKSREKLLADSVVMNNIAMVYILKEDYSKALEYLKPIYQRGDKSPKLVHNLILSLIKTHDYVGAEKVIQDEKIPQTLEQLITALGGVQVAIKESQFEPKNTNNKNNVSTSNTQKVKASQQKDNTASSASPFMMADASTPVTNGLIANSTSALNSVEQPVKSGSSLLLSDNQPAASQAASATAKPGVATTSNVPESLITAEPTNTAVSVVGSPEKKSSASIQPEQSTKTVNQPTNVNTSNLASRATISDVRMADNAKGSRLVIESDKEIKFNVLKSDTANQLIVELNNFNQSNLLNNTGLYLRKKHKTVESITLTPSGENKVKMIFQFKRKVNSKVYRMGPEDHYKDRVVIDLID